MWVCMRDLVLADSYVCYLCIYLVFNICMYIKNCFIVATIPLIGINVSIGNLSNDRFILRFPVHNSLSKEKLILSNFALNVSVGPLAKIICSGAMCFAV